MLIPAVNEGEPQSGSEDKAGPFYRSHYEVIVDITAAAGTKIILGDLVNRQCRFCLRSRPEATFKKEAHAIPEALGNQSLFTAYECDDCNDRFGSTVEDHLGKWSKPERLLQRIEGKNGVPTIKKGGDRGWSISFTNDAGLVVKEFPEEPIVEYDEQTDIATLSLRREAHVPVAIIKSFWKMAYSVMPEEELPNFRELLFALNRDPYESLGAGAGILRTFYPGPSSISPRLAIIRRRRESDMYPYAFFILHYGNATYQAPLPTSFDPKSFELYYFQFNDAPRTEHYGAAFHEILDLSSTIITREPFIGRLKMDN